LQPDFPAAQIAPDHCGATIKTEARDNQDENAQPLG
jgi:hypothetical protein